MTQQAASATAWVTVLVLNWNGWQDTIECIQSLLYSTYDNIQVVVLDNGSSDGSLKQIASWATGRSEPLTVVCYDREQAESGGDAAYEEATFAGVPPLRRLILVDNGENLGFAAGNNVGIRLALARSSTYVLLLNNDTVVEKAAVERLVRLLGNERALVGATAQIRYYDTDEIWNCGGDLTWYGGRRYHLHGASASQVPATGWRSITFLTGCAAFFRTSLFSQVGLLSERFFFGEEDFELSQRLKRAQKPLACCYGSQVRHKVSRSVDQAAQVTKTGALVKKVHLYYLNRFIDMRDFYPLPIWHIWRLTYMGYICVLLTLRLRISPSTTLEMLKNLWVESTLLNCVSRATFERVLQGQGLLGNGGKA